MAMDKAAILDEVKFDKLISDIKAGNSPSELDFSKEKLTNIQIKALFEALQTEQQQSITSLDLSHNYLFLTPQNYPSRDEFYDLLVNFLRANPQLEILNLSGCLLGDEGATEVAVSISNHPSLSSLDLSNNAIGNAGAIAIAKALDENGSIEELNLAENAIDIAGAIRIAVTLEIHSLKSLILNSNPIGDAGVKALAKALEINPSLVILAIRDAKVGVEGGTELARVLETNQSLKILDISKNNMVETGNAPPFARAIEKNTSIILLNMNENLKNSFYGGESGLPKTSENLQDIIKALKKNKSLRSIHFNGSALEYLGINHLAVTMKGNDRIFDLNFTLDKSATQNWYDYGFDGYVEKNQLTYIPPVHISLQHNKRKAEEELKASLLKLNNELLEIIKLVYSEVSLKQIASIKIMDYLKMIQELRQKMLIELLIFEKLLEGKHAHQENPQNVKETVTFVAFVDYRFLSLCDNSRKQKLKSQEPWYQITAAVMTETLKTARRLMSFLRQSLHKIENEESKIESETEQRSMPLEELMTAQEARMNMDKKHNDEKAQLKERQDTEKKAMEERHAKVIAEENGTVKNLERQQTQALIGLKRDHAQRKQILENRYREIVMSIRASEPGKKIIGGGFPNDTVLLDNIEGLIQTKEALENTLKAVHDLRILNPINSSQLASRPFLSQGLSKEDYTFLKPLSMECAKIKHELDGLEAIFKKELLSLENNQYRARQAEEEHHKKRLIDNKRDIYEKEKQFKLQCEQEIQRLLEQQLAESFASLKLRQNLAQELKRPARKQSFQKIQARSWPNAASTGSLSSHSTSASGSASEGKLAASWTSLSSSLADLMSASSASYSVGSSASASLPLLYDGIKTAKLTEEDSDSAKPRSAAAKEEGLDRIETEAQECSV